MAEARSIGINDITLEISGRDWLGTDLIEGAGKTWSITVLCDVESPDGDEEAEAAEPAEIAIGHGRATVISLSAIAEAKTSPWMVFDMISNETLHLYEVYDEDEGWWHDDLDLFGHGDTALFLETLSLEPAYRGQGLGPAILVGIIDRLRSGCAFAAMEPHPIGDPLDGRSVEQAIKSLERTWSAVGFEPFRNGVWVLDFGTTAFDMCRREILHHDA